MTRRIENHRAFHLASLGLLAGAALQTAAAQCHWFNVPGGQAGDSIVADLGQGPRLLVGGGDGIRAWDGQSWSDAGLNMYRVAVLQTMGHGTEQIVAASADYSGGDDRLCWHVEGEWRWLGGNYKTPRYPSGWRYTAHLPEISSVAAFGSFDDGNGPALYVGGARSNIGRTALYRNYGQWGAWQHVAMFTGEDPWIAISSMEVFDDGSGSALYVAGTFDAVEGVPARNLARWDGKAWSAVGELDPGKNARLLVFDDGNGPSLYANSHRWNGVEWESVGRGSAHFALGLHRDGGGPALYSLTREGLERWNGAGWDMVGAGVSMEPYGLSVSGLHSFDDGLGAGPSLYAVGTFNLAGTVQVNGMARWSCSAQPVLSMEAP